MLPVQRKNYSDAPGGRKARHETSGDILVTDTPSIDLDFSSFSPEAFESLVYDILDSKSFYNLRWRQGGSDGGRDLEAYSREIDASGYERDRSWFCEVKHHRGGVSFDKIHPALTQADSQELDYLLLAVSSHLTPQCKDKLNDWLKQRKSFEVRIWEKKELTDKLLQEPEILRKHFPEAWGKLIEMRVYLQEAARVLRDFGERVEVVWKAPHGGSFSDAIQLSALDGRPIFMLDDTHHLGDSEHSFIEALLTAAKHMEDLLGAVFALDENTVLKMVKRTSSLVGVVVDLRESFLAREAERVNSLLSDAEDRLEESKSGFLAARGSWAPYDAANTIRAYVLATKEES